MPLTGHTCRTGCRILTPKRMPTGGLGWWPGMMARRASGGLSSWTGRLSAVFPWRGWPMRIAPLGRFVPEEPGLGPGAGEEWLPAGGDEGRGCREGREDDGFEGVYSYSLVYQSLFIEQDSPLQPLWVTGDLFPRISFVGFPDTIVLSRTLNKSMLLSG